MRRPPTTTLIGLALALVAVLLLGVALGRSARPAAEVAPPHVPAPSTAPASPGEPSPASEPTGHAGDPEPSPTQAGSDAGAPSGVPYSKTGQARDEWEPVVTGFAENYPRTEGGGAAWRNRLNGYVTPAVAKQLTTVDVRNVDQGTYLEYEPLAYDEGALTVRAWYDQGWALVLYMIYDGDTWRIYQYDRDEE